MTSSCVQITLYTAVFTWFYKRFTHPLQVFTIKKLQANCQPVALLYCFTQSILVMKIYSLAFLLLFHPITIGFPFVFPIPDSQPIQKTDKAATANIVFKSADGGQTWQDISKGLPENWKKVVFFANESGLWLRAGKGTYHSNPHSNAPFWQKEIFPDNWSSIAAGKSGMFAYNYWGQIVQKISGTSVWSPVYTNFKSNIRTVFETAGGAIFVGSDNGLYKSADNGKTWKQVHAGGWVIKMVEQRGILVATSQSGIIQSTDGGETWSVVISEGGVGIDVAPIQGGFAAITYNTASETRRVRTSYDGGKTWQPIDAGLPPSSSISSIIQVGEYFFCGHPAGIFRSSDKEKTWKLLLPAVENKVFNLSVSGNVIYAIPSKGGC
jgi:photosystem II stability/assembly factor-like uncharacterized protein